VLDILLHLSNLHEQITLINPYLIKLIVKSPGMTAAGFYLLPYSIELIEPFLFTPRFYSFKSIRTAAAGSFLGYQKANRTYGMIV